MVWNARVPWYGLSAGSIGLQKATRTPRLSAHAQLESDGSKPDLGSVSEVA